jgi:F0F1-type ATP synthase assembly protein I
LERPGLKIGRVVRLGLVTVILAGVPLAVGLWLDASYTAWPLSTLAGAVVGVIVCTVAIVRHISKVYAELGPRHCTDPVDEGGDEE